MRVFKLGEERGEKFLKRLELCSTYLVTEQLLARTRSVIGDVKRRGDAALLRYIKREELTGLSAQEVRSSGPVWEPSEDPMEEVRSALDAAVEAAKDYYSAEKIDGFAVDRDGTLLGLRMRPVGSVGIVVPGPTAPYLELLLSAAVAASVAGVQRVAVAVSPKAFLVSPALRYLLERLELSEVYFMVGAHAAAAMALGTETVERVDSLVLYGGPELHAAASLLMPRCGIAHLGGPPELVIVADQNADPGMLAADLASWIEWEPNSMGVILATSERVASRAAAKFRNIVRRSGKGSPLRDASKRWAAVVTVPDLLEACSVADRLAPETVYLCVEDPLRLLDRVQNAGRVLLGEWSPPAVGSYAGIPAMGVGLARARFAGSLSVGSFIKTTAYVRVGAHHYPKYAQAAGSTAGDQGLEMRAPALAAGARGER